MDTSIIISGYGGQGLLFAGVLLCHAAMLEGKQTTWIPAYGAEMRGGSANCSVHISDDEVSSPIVNISDVVFALNQPSEDKFENRVKSGGLFIVNSSMAKVERKRDDIEYLFIPMNELAAQKTASVFINVLAVGAFVEKSGILQKESVKDALKLMMTGKKAHLLEANVRSFDYGVEFVKELEKVRL